MEAVHMSEFKTAAEIMALDDRPVVELDVPIWGMVRARGLTSKQLSVFTMAAARMGDGDIREIRERLIRQSLVDAEGEPLFAQTDDLSAKSNATVHSLFQQLFKLNRLDVDGEDVVGALAGN